MTGTRSQARRPASIRRREKSVAGSTRKPRGRRWSGWRSTDDERLTAPTDPAVLSPPAGAEGRSEARQGVAPAPAIEPAVLLRGRPPSAQREGADHVDVDADRGVDRNVRARRARRSPRRRRRMRVRKRNGAFEPVDVNKIVRAVSRCCVGLADVDALRVATKTISGLYDGATTRELDQLSIQTAAALIVEEPQYAKLAARLLATYIDKEVRGQEIHAFSQSIAAAQRLGLVNERLAELRRRQRAQAERRHRQRARSRVRVLRPAHALRPLPAEAPADAHGDRDAAAVLPADRLRAVRDGRRGARAVPPVLVARVPAELADAVQRRARGTSSSRAASCSTRPTTTWRRSTSATPTSRCSRSSRAASASRTTACARAAR